MRIFTECYEVALVAEILNGKTVVLPTETAYGLGCDATNQTAVDAIFKIKGRRRGKPLIVVVPSVAMAKEYLAWNELLEKIAQTHWPGAVTVVGKRKKGKGKGDSLARGVVARDNTVAVRVTAHPLLKSLTEKLGRPLVATSANLAGAGEFYDSKQVIEQFKNRSRQPDIMLDYGVLPRRRPTTVVSVVCGTFNIIRQGEAVVRE